MEAIDLLHTYVEHPGRHIWDYWPVAVPLATYMATETAALAT
jgi:hypothetical protein